MRLSVHRSAGPVFAVVLLLGGCGGATDEPANQPAAATRQVPAAKETSAQGKAPDLHFLPATYGEGDRVVLPITFTDGTRAELVYPRELDIAGLGGGPYGSGSLKGESPTPGRSDVVARDFRILYGEVDDVLLSLNGGEAPRLLAEYQGVGQKVGFWDFRANDDADYLAFQFGRWPSSCTTTPPTATSRARR